MGSLRKALEKAGYLNPVATSFQEFLRRQKEDADQEQFNQYMNEAATNIRKTYSDTKTPGLSQMPGSLSRLGDLVPPPPDKLSLSSGDPSQFNLAADMDQEGLKLKTDIPEYEQQDVILKEGIGRKHGTITADEQRMKIQQSIVDALMKSSQLKNLPPEKLQQGLQILDLTGKSYTPKQKTKQLKEFDLRKDLYEIDEDGNIQLIRSGVPEKKDKSIGSYVGNDGYHYIQIMDPVSGETYEIKSDKPVRPQKSTTVKIEYPKPEKWKDFGSVINMIDYKTDPNGNLIETTPVEKKQYREVAQNMALGNMLPGSVDFMRTRIWNAWNRENMSQADFESEIEEGLSSGEVSPDEAQDLLDYNEFRPFIYDELIESIKVTEEGDQQ